ncbi:hypothetical protein G7Z17_g10357 [Cylindrodendrum hubeiense]|uniref:Uncharacterized protein n=1 Tax=Cylindrodendrum hubeiense TaxID=595255 RepID=A0A9P5L7B8_9HYPO|nr:hypothetical protein G7Z17_g10357 [Cylindrodendrum hubeiense]
MDDLCSLYGFCICPRGCGVSPESQAVDEGDDDDEDFTALPPSIPDPYDDSPAERSASMKDVEPKPEIEKSPELRQRPRRPRRPRQPRCFLMRLPLEIRDEIYREILVVGPPILVRAGWRRIYARKRPGIGTGIMRTNKRINNETVRILYGENRFLYRLRDPPDPRYVVNVEQLSLNDSKEDGLGSEPDDDAPESNDDAFDPGKGQGDVDGDDCAPRERNDRIDIAKFGSYFRRLIVEAERNRYSDDTQFAMAEAIKVFTAQRGILAKACSGGVKTNIKTFTIRVSPQYQLGDSNVVNFGEQDPQHTFTFIDFFNKDSLVLDAIKSLSCQYIKIDLLTSYLNGGTDPKISRLTIDMRHLRFSQFAARQKTSGGPDFWRQDLWRKDKQILQQRIVGAKRSTAALLNLEKHVFKACNNHVKDDVFQLYMEELENDYDGMMDWEQTEGDEYEDGNYEEVRLGFDDDSE